MNSMHTPATGQGQTCVVHIHLGPKLPSYFWDTVRQTRRFHTGPILCVLPSDEVTHSCVHALGLTAIPNDSFDSDELVLAVNRTSWLEKRYGGNGFWHYTLLRLFVLNALLQRFEIEGCLHLENDVVIYRPPSLIWPTLQHCYGRRCAVAPLGPTSGCTAAVMYVGSRAALTDLCLAVLKLLEQDEASLKSRIGADMINEMVLLGIVRQELPEVLGALPVAPCQPKFYPSQKRVFKPWARPFLRLFDWLHPKLLDTTPPERLSEFFAEIGLLFDPAFWGQYAGGTPHGDGPGFSAPHHWVGNDLQKGRYVLHWEHDKQGARIPFVQVVATGVKWPLFNLHIHCKRITEFS
ncbi:MAG: hypothetical protein ACT4NV_02325 [Rhodoferax sp.]